MLRPRGPSPGWLLCHQLNAVVGFLLFNPLLWKDSVFIHCCKSAQKHISPQSTRSHTKSVGVHKVLHLGLKV